MSQKEEFKDDCPCGHTLYYYPVTGDRSFVRDGQMFICGNPDCSIESYASVDAGGCWVQAYDEEVDL